MAPLPVVHNLQFSTYPSPRKLRRRHSWWPVDAGRTTSHGRLAGVWIRIGSWCAWFCLERQCKVARMTHRPLPVEIPPAGQPDAR